MIRLAKQPLNDFLENRAEITEFEGTEQNAYSVHFQEEMELGDLFLCSGSRFRSQARSAMVDEAFSQSGFVGAYSKTAALGLPEAPPPSIPPTPAARQFSVRSSLRPDNQPVPPPPNLKLSLAHPTRGERGGS